MKRVGIFTANSVDILHPRIKLQKETLEASGYNVEVIRSTSSKDSGGYELLNKLTLKYFKWGSIRKFRLLVSGYDIVHIYDFQLLPLSKHAKKQGCKVIYETLDDNVFLNFHAVEKKIPLIRPLKKVITGWAARYEHRMANSFCDCVIVNSDNLVPKFKRAELIYYASHLEKCTNKGRYRNVPTALLYLGKLSGPKGADTYAKLIEQYCIPILFIGKPSDQSANNLISNNLVTSFGNMEAQDLIPLLDNLLSSYNLIGLSIIRPENESYRFQEANKDIDYMALGIPFIGNERKPTLKKIEQGVGVLVSNELGIRTLIENTGDAYDRMCQKSIGVYKKTFSIAIFRSKLLGVYRGL